jgi:hypothetical protein
MQRMWARSRRGEIRFSVMAVLLFVVSVVRGGGSRLVRLATVAIVLAVAGAGFVAAPVQAALSS